MPGIHNAAPTAESLIIDVTKPDLVALLCIYRYQNYAEVLVFGLIDLTEFILYAFQPHFWQNNSSSTVNLDPVTALCKEAVELREEQIQNPEFDPTADNFGRVVADIDAQDEWGAENADAQILQSLL